MRKLLWTLSFIGALAGALFLIAGLVGDNEFARQETMAIVGVACAAIPYCLARAASEWVRSDRDES